LKPFRDFDGHEHFEGEAWWYLGSNFFPYDDGLSLFVSIDGQQEWQIPMRCSPEDQGPIAEAFDRYVAEVAG